MTKTYDLTPIRGVSGLFDDEIALINELIRVWWKKRNRNFLREKYYLGHNRLKDLGISIPPPLRRIEMYVGWPAKAVDYMANRTVLEGFTFNGTDSNSVLDECMSDNDFISMYSQAVTDALVSSCSFLSVTKGADDEPSALVSMHSARDASAIWDYRLKRIKAALVVADVRRDASGNVIGPSRVNVFTDSEVISLEWRRNGKWVLSGRYKHRQGQPLIEAIRYSPRLGRPFGKSRINRAVMSITDSAVREALRGEISAEFSAAPQKYILGADDDLFQDKPKWEAYIGTILAVAGDSSSDTQLSVGQFSQGSMSPHVEYERDLAARFSGETGIPISSLGVIHDNPSSAEAIYAAKEDIVIEASNFNRDNRSALCRIARLMLAVSQNIDISELSDSELTVQPRFMNPSIPSIASQTDAVIKQASAVPEFANTRVFWEQLGYDDAQIARILSDIRKSRAQNAMNALLGRGDANGDTTHNSGQSD